jgi:hypothetical protein
VLIIVAFLAIGPLINFLYIYKRKKKLNELLIRLQNFQQEKMFSQHTLDDMLRGILSERVIVKSNGSLDLSNFMSIRDLEKLYTVLQNSES